MITPQPDLVIAGKYTLVRPLASGGMGSVWIAQHRELEIDVTVKFMAPELVADRDLRARFEREARVAARLDSQHVVHVLDYGVESDTPYLVMELLKGESLGTRLSRAGRIALPDAERLVIQLCKALRTAHEAGLVHRDLKPANIFLALKDEDEVAKVLDFGIAKVARPRADEVNTNSKVMLGSAHYMSPEQIRSTKSVDHRSDLWSLGVILYRALTGQLPFPGEEIGDIIVRVCVDPIPPPSSVVPDLPPAVDAFFAQALARDLDKRFQSAREMTAAFSALMLGTSAEPSPPPLLEMPQRTVPMASSPSPWPQTAEAGSLAASDVTTQKVPPKEPVAPPESSATTLVTVNERAPPRLLAHRSSVRALWQPFAVLAVAALVGLIVLGLRTGLLAHGAGTTPRASPTEPTVSDTAPAAPEPSTPPMLTATSASTGQPPSTATALPVLASALHSPPAKPWIVPTTAVVSAPPPTAKPPPPADDKPKDTPLVMP